MESLFLRSINKFNLITMFSVYTKNKMNWNYAGLYGRVGVSFVKVTMPLISVQPTKQGYVNYPRNINMEL
jgi:hypothetical protein